MIAGSDSNMVVGCQLGEGGRAGRTNERVGRPAGPALSSSRATMTSDDTRMIS